ncbi:proton-coupled folate transporter [Hyalella azteca]|uniref:Proton-coupled folate transporter n=1 Tax=Hyalella azteca TaxID=294128 RepID=A0A8B7NET2_HYAAZ|nr:proton-coupled folate transporter [Hyalella azteca]
MAAMLWTRALQVIKATTLEPAMLVDGAASNAMIILMENVQMIKTCTHTLGFSEEVCNNLSLHEEANILVQKELSMFTFYNSIILSIVALLFILFMGAWSDVYGRKFPLVLTFLCQVINAAGYLLVLMVPSMPIEIIYGASLIMSLGGGNPGLMSIAFSYASDISSEEDRTLKISTLNSLWYLGGPIGTALTGFVLRHSTYHMALSIMLGLNTFGLLYIIFFIKESCGPFAKIGNCLKEPGKQTLKKEDVTLSRMVVDFVNWRRVAESFHTLFKARPGYNRALLFTSVVCNMARRAARSFFLYLFARIVLGWDASYYSYWTTSRILITAVSSLFLVPLLSNLLKASDYTLVAYGSVSSALEFAAYALVLSPAYASIMWVSPILGLLTNAQIALRSFPTKIVDPDEKGRVTAATGALTSLMPMAGYACYTAIYKSTVASFPGAQFIFGAAINLAIAILFICLYAVNRNKNTSKDDVENISGKSTLARKLSNAILAGSVQGSEHFFMPVECQPASKPAVSSQHESECLSIEIPEGLKLNAILCNEKVHRIASRSYSLGTIKSSSVQRELKRNRTYSNPLTDDEIKFSEN